MTELIERDNYLDVQAFLLFQRQDLQNDPGTVQTYWSRLRHLLEWAQEKRFTMAHAIRPTYPAYLDKLNAANGAPIGAAQFGALTKTARAFFLWAIKEHPGRYRAIDQNWIQSIRPPRARNEKAELKNRILYEKEEVIKLAQAKTTTVAERRIQAGAVFLFLSGMRIGAFASLPILCVDLPNHRVLQLPERGVRTKNRKAAVTTLLDVPELMRVVMEWDGYLRGRIAETCLWFAHLDHQGELTSDQPDARALAGRRQSFNDELRRLCALAGVEYKSAHKFRHGHAVYALKRARTVEQLKAISQNLMHSTIGITDGIYGNLVQDDVHNVILGLSGEHESDGRAEQDISKLVEAALRKIIGEGAKS